MDRHEVLAVAKTIYSQIERGSLWALGAGKVSAVLVDDMPGLSFPARILPFRADGTRASRPRVMKVEVLLNGLDLYDVRVTWRQGAEIRTHFQLRNVYAEDLTALMLSLDFDGATIVNPRMAPCEAEKPAPMPKPAAGAEALPVGTILASQWGYEQTNVDFYQVVAATAQTVQLRPIRSRVTGEAGFMSEHVTAAPDEFTGEAFRRKVITFGSSPFVAINDHANAYVWEGAELTASHYA